jgi:pyridoxal phosphate enzyme (YggS family)
MGGSDGDRVSREGEDVKEVATNLATVQAQITAAARRVGRDPADITLVAVTKTVPVPRIAEALAAGLLDLGENRAQELLEKAPQLAGGPVSPRWHFVGALQRNKVKALVPWVSLWQSVDRESLGTELGRRSPGARVLVEVNLAGEAAKAGCPPNAAPALADALRVAGLVVEGLMTVPPAGDPPRRWFAQLAELAARMGVRELSMGMTDDFEVAIEEGATIVRVGRAIFGRRSLAGVRG